jgi:chaperonin cofactor prefoldin
VSDKNGNVLELEQLVKNLETRDNRIKDLERQTKDLEERLVVSEQTLKNEKQKSISQND